MSTSHEHRLNQRAAGARAMLHSSALLLSLLFAACPGTSTSNSINSNSATTTATPMSSANPTDPRPAFDGNRAFAHVSKMVEIGPRPAGSAELAKTRQYIIGELQSYGLKVTTDEFNAKTPVGDRKMVNITAELPGDSPDVILMTSHYDTKPIKGMRFVGANDGGSSTGTLLELARSLASAKQKPHLTYWFAFFDGEEAFCFDWDECRNPDGPDNTYGSRRYVAHLNEQGELKRVRAMILLDMMGYKNLQLKRDSMGSTWLADIIWRTGQEIGYGSTFVDGEEGVGGDDHEPFLKQGVDAVDLIQLNGYPYWHKADDTLDKISPRSMQIVGETIIASLPKIEQHLKR